MESMKIDLNSQIKPKMTKNYFFNRRPIFFFYPFLTIRTDLNRSQGLKTPHINNI